MPDHIDLNKGIEKQCPHCGYCPTCGRSNAYWPSYPWWIYTYPPIITTYPKIPPNTTWTSISNTC
jgi:hypothetical protein